jgi:hypothetical protein
MPFRISSDKSYNNLRTINLKAINADIDNLTLENGIPLPSVTDLPTPSSLNKGQIYYKNGNPYISTGSLWKQLIDRLNYDQGSYVSVDEDSGSPFDIDTYTNYTNVSTSSNGQKIAVGLKNNNSTMGIVRIYNYLNGNLTLDSNILPTNTTTDSYFGYSLMLSNDGNTLVVGGPKSITGNTYIYSYSSGNSTWSGVRLLGTGYIASPKQGACVAISGDGNTVASGGSNDNTGIGAIWIYTGSGVSWSQQTKLVPTSYTGTPHLGCSISLSDDGNILAAGGSGDSSGLGAVWIFNRTSNVWSQQQKIVGVQYSGLSANMGKSVALNGNGDVLAFGGPEDNSSIGATWIFKRSGTTWSQRDYKIVSSDVGAQSQGTSVSLNSDGNVLVIGGPSSYILGTQTGKIFIWKYDGYMWTQQATKNLDILSEFNSFFGYDVYHKNVANGTSVSISSSGNIIASYDQSTFAGTSTHGTVSIYSNY